MAKQNNENQDWALGLVRIRKDAIKFSQEDIGRVIDCLELQKGDNRILLQFPEADGSVRLKLKNPAAKISLWLTAAPVEEFRPEPHPRYKDIEESFNYSTMMF